MEARGLYKGDFINGTFVPVSQADGTLERHNPTKPNEAPGLFPFSLNQVNSAVEAAKKAFPAWSTLSEDKRWDFLEALRKEIEKEAHLLASEISREIGKAMWEARIEIQSVSNKFKITRESAMKFVRSFKVNSGIPHVEAECRFKPRGILAVLSPFNFPLHLAMGHLIPALACGNTVIMKPSELAPSVSTLLAEMFLRANFPPGVFNLVLGDGKVGERLCAHPEVNGILFTGSYRVGKQIQKSLIDQPHKFIALEMGGKNASVIWEDAKIPQASRMAFQSATVTTGQRCTATSRLLVHKKIWPEVKAHLLSMSAAIKIGDPLDESVYMGPFVSEAALKNFKRLTAVGEEEGAEVLSAPNAAQLPLEGYFIAPSLHLLKSFDAKSSYCDEELFGPDLAIYLIDSVDEAASIIEQSKYGFAASIFTQNKETFETFLATLTAGVINWNRPTTGASSQLPFGGQKASGNHFPTALFAPYYCTYPVASLEDPSGDIVDNIPGFITN